MSHSNGKIYVDTTTTPHKGIDIRNDIAYVLGRNTGNLGMLYWDLDRDGKNVAASVQFIYGDITLNPFARPVYVMVKPAGTGMPRRFISARLAPLPPSSSLILPSPSACLPPKR